MQMNVGGSNGVAVKTLALFKDGRRHMHPQGDTRWSTLTESTSRQHSWAVVTTVASKQEGPRFESTGQLWPFCAQFVCSPCVSVVFSKYLTFKR